MAQRCKPRSLSLYVTTHSKAKKKKSTIANPRKIAARIEPFLFV